MTVLGRFASEEGGFRGSKVSQVNFHSSEIKMVSFEHFFLTNLDFGQKLNVVLRIDDFLQAPLKAL